MTLLTDVTVNKFSELPFQMQVNGKENCLLEEKKAQTFWKSDKDIYFNWGTKVCSGIPAVYGKVHGSKKLKDVGSSLHPPPNMSSTQVLPLIDRTAGPFLVADVKAKSCIYLYTLCDIRPLVRFIRQEEYFVKESWWQCWQSFDCSTMQSNTEMIHLVTGVDPGFRHEPWKLEGFQCSNMHSLAV